MAPVPTTPQVAGARGDDDAIVYDPNGHYLLAVQTHCKVACSALLQTMLHHFHLTQWLQTMKQFFLLNKADFLTIFFGLAYNDLHTVASKVSIMRMRSCLDTAIRSSCLVQNPQHEHVLLSLDSPSFSQIHSVSTRHFLLDLAIESIPSMQQQQQQQHLVTDQGCISGTRPENISYISFE
jgi:hypothetical protein